MLIFETQHRAIGHCYAGLVKIETGARFLTLVLEHAPAGHNRWRSSLYDTRETILGPAPLWQSEQCEAATQALDALLEYLSSLGLPHDLQPLMLALLPATPIGAPAYSLS